jgi:hypothetical protein
MKVNLDLIDINHNSHTSLPLLLHLYAYDGDDIITKPLRSYADLETRHSEIGTSLRSVW